MIYLKNIAKKMRYFEDKIEIKYKNPKAKN